MAKPTKIVTKKSFSLTTIIIVSLLVISVLVGAYFFIRYTQVNTKYQAAILTDEQRNQQYVVKVAKLYNIPKFETEKPVVIEVKDTSKLADTVSAKKFFTDVKNGDIILAYQKADLSVIFRPSENKIIHTDNYANFVGATTPITVALIAPADQQEAVANNLKQKFGNVQIITKSIPKTEITTSYVVDATGTNAKLAKELADGLGISVGQLPEGELKPEGSSLIVVIAKPATQ